MERMAKLLKKTQEKANESLALVCRIIIILLIGVEIANYTGIFVIPSHEMNVAVIITATVLFIPTVVYNFLHLNSVLVRYFIVTSLTIMSAVLYSFLSYHVVIMLVFPVIAACVYSDIKCIIYTSVIGVPAMIASHVIAFQLKVVPDEPLTSMHSVIYYGIIPRLAEYAAIVVVCVLLTRRMQILLKGFIDKSEDIYNEQEETVQSLSQLIEARSKETGQHVKRVAEYTKILCRAYGFDDDMVWHISTAAMMHDIGKILVPAEIIEKPGKLTDEEFEMIKKHTDYGKKLLENVTSDIMKTAAVIAYEHHEKWDGSGYHHIQGEKINIYARFVAVADVFDALVSWRPYKEPWSLDKAYNEIVSQSGKHFDPYAVELFVENFDKFKNVFNMYPDSLENAVTEINQM